MPSVDADARHEGDIPHDAAARLDRTKAGALALDMIALLIQHHGIALGNLPPAVAATVREGIAGIEAAMGHAGVPGGAGSEERRACWTCGHANGDSCDIYDNDRPRDWIIANCDENGVTLPTARDCPGWAPRGSR